MFIILNQREIHSNVHTPRTTQTTEDLDTIEMYDTLDRHPNARTTTQTTEDLGTIDDTL